MPTNSSDEARQLSFTSNVHVLKKKKKLLSKAKTHKKDRNQISGCRWMGSARNEIEGDPWRKFDLSDELVWCGIGVMGT